MGGGRGYRYVMLLMYLWGRVGGGEVEVRNVTLRTTTPPSLPRNKHCHRCDVGGVEARGRSRRGRMKGSAALIAILAVLRIHDILGWIRIRIRIRGSMPLTNGSGSGSWIRILLFSSLTFKMPAKN
jgi:hypothetical protein